MNKFHYGYVVISDFCLYSYDANRNGFPETRVYADPSETKVPVGNTFIIDLKTADVIDLHGYDI